MYWWSGMKGKISEFVVKCIVCQQLVMIPEWKWEQVMMDFVSGLPILSRKKYSILVIVDR
ncbi:integrase [Gossypium australe]|uniref:Integrase n=1 Tax=Gossypium australe TaxID=47621 RepID=A0A5B6X390_9ROSI|nr:integrase [Gossypium australe]